MRTSWLFSFCFCLNNVQLQQRLLLPGNRRRSSRAFLVARRVVAVTTERMGGWDGVTPWVGRSDRKAFWLWIFPAKTKTQKTQHLNVQTRDTEGLRSCLRFLWLFFQCLIGFDSDGFMTHTLILVYYRGAFLVPQNCSLCSLVRFVVDVLMLALLTSMIIQILQKIREIIVN